MTRRDRAWLIAIAAAAAIPRLWLATRHGLEYDGYWHLFIARQDHWPTFRAELFRNAHPPLYFLLLKLILPFTGSLVWYRSISMVAGVMSIFAFGTVALRAVEYRAAAFIATAAFGFAISSIWLSIEIRSYAAAMLLFLVAFRALLELTAGVGNDRNRHRAVFAVCASAATLCHYGMLFPIAAAAAAAPVLSAGPLKRSTNADRLRDIAVVAIPFSMFAVAWALHARHWVRPLNHLPDFYLATSGLSAGEFLVAGLSELATMFSPIDPQGLGAALSIAVLALSAAFAIAETRAGRVAAAMIHGVFVILAVTLAAAGILGLYPVGGEMRQQYLLFPFCVLSIFAMIDRLIRAIPAERGRIALAAALAVCVALSAAAQFRAFGVNSRKLFEPALESLISRVPESQPGRAPRRSAVWVDQFSLIVVFSRHHSAHWRYLGSPAGNSEITAYSIEDERGQLLLLRDRSRWTVHLEDTSLYREMAAHGRALGLTRIVLVSADQTRSRTIDGRLLRSIDERSRAGGLVRERIEIGKEMVLGVFAIPRDDRLR